MAARLVPEGGRSLPEGAEGAGEGGLSAPEAATQAAVAVLEQSFLAILVGGLLVVPVFLLGRGLRCCHPLLTLLLSSLLALAPLLFCIAPSTLQGQGDHITRTLRAELFSPANTAQQERTGLVDQDRDSLHRSPTQSRAGDSSWEVGSRERAESSGILSLGWRTLESKGKLSQP